MVTSQLFQVSKKSFVFVFVVRYVVLSAETNKKRQWWVSQQQQERGISRGGGGEAEKFGGVGKLVT